jgi:hypothetical protein
MAGSKQPAKHTAFWQNNPMQSRFGPQTLLVTQHIVAKLRLSMGTFTATTIAVLVCCTTTCHCREKKSYGRDAG